MKSIDFMTAKKTDFKELPNFENRNTFLFVGTLYAQKGLGELIEAYQSALNKCPNLQFLLHEFVGG